MARLTALCLASWLGAAVVGAEPPESKPAPLTREQQEQLKERDRLVDEAHRLWDDGKQADAVTVYAKKLAIERAVLGPLHPEVVSSLQFLANMHESLGNLPAARQARQEVLAVQTKRFGGQHWQVTDARIGLADVEQLARLAPADRGRLTEADALNERADRLSEQGKSREAIPLAQKACELRKQVLGERHHRYAQSLNNLALLYQEEGEYARAAPLFRQVADITRQVRGEHHPHYATSLDNLAVLYQDQGDLARAEPLCRQALDITRQALGERNADYATRLNNLAGVYFAQGEYGRAEPLCRQALEVTREVSGERHAHYATSLSNLARLYQAQGEYAQAEPLLRQAADVNRRVQGEFHPDYAATLNALGGVYKAEGDYVRAEPLYRQALDIYERARGERHPDYARSLGDLASLYEARGEYARVLPLYRQALAIVKQALGERHPDYATGLNNLALAYDLQGDYVHAERLYRQALAVTRQAVGERHPLYATQLNNLAGVYEAQREYARAEPLYRQALEIKKQVLGEHHPDCALSLNNLAGLYHAQKQYAKAEPLYRQALELRRRGLGERHPEYAHALNNLASCYEFGGDPARAEPLYRQAIGVLRQRPGGPLPDLEHLTRADLRPLPDTVTCLANYCLFLGHRLRGRPTVAQLRTADRVFALTLDVRERLCQEVLEQDASKLRHGTEAQFIVPDRIGVCRQLFDREGRAADLEAALTTAEQGTARVFLEQLGKARALAVGRVAPELRHEEAALRQRLRALDAQLAQEQARPPDRRDPERVGQLLDEQKRVEQQRDALVRRLERDYPQYAALKYPKPCSLAEARACLAPTEVALLFLPGDENSSVVLVEARPAADDQAHGLAIFPLPGQDELADSISCLTDPEVLALPARARCAGEQAYDALLGPLKHRLRGKDLVVVPGGPLGYVPFEALVEDGRFLIEKHRVRYAPSLTALHLVRLWEQQRKQPDRPLWALGDPIYDPTDGRLHGQPAEKAALASASPDAVREVRQRQGAGGSFRRLKASGDEVRAVARRLGAAADDVLTGAAALEVRVKEASASGRLARARYVHFATHGILGLDTGQPPALVLSLVGNDGQPDADGGVNDGFLRLDEVTRLQLNADLVVLSACETGRGRLYAGEGVTGLARAFLSAGSRGVVCSLWPVDDRETAAFMADLYGGLKNGQAAADALRAAKLKMIRAGKPPVYWAPFVLIGE
jgi:CHAT domain-containing protein/tetratricopeptide (TPR) repeat protein